MSDKNSGPPNLGVVQVSGLRFKYEPEKSYPKRITEVTVNGKKLERKRNYHVATNTLLAGGGHNYTTFLEGKNVEEGEPQYEVVKLAIQQRGTLRTPKPGRIEKSTQDYQ